LLENGANTSFVNRIADQTISLEDLVRDPIDEIEDDPVTLEGQLGLPYSAIALPRDLYGPNRINARGMDLSHEAQLAALAVRSPPPASALGTVMPMLAMESARGELQPVPKPRSPPGHGPDSAVKPRSTRWSRPCNRLSMAPSSGPRRHSTSVQVCLRRRLTDRRPR
jgi:hypothetical protein